jgi:hypothetical protein
VGRFEFGLIEMGLSIRVFNLAEVIETEDDSVWISKFREHYEALNRALQRNNIAQYQEPEIVANYELRHWIDDFSYRDLHHLRRFYAHVHHDPQALPHPLEEGERPLPDSVIDAVSNPKHHLLYHADDRGFYVPVEFEEAICDVEVEGEVIGSSQRLMTELLFVAPFLGINISDGVLTDEEAEKINDAVKSAEDPYETEKAVWFALFEYAKTSIDYNTAIVFC